MHTSFAVDATQVYDGDVGFKETVPLMAAFAVVGLILLFAALRLIRRARPRKNHSDRYISHHH